MKSPIMLHPDVTEKPFEESNWVEITHNAPLTRIS